MVSPIKYYKSDPNTRNGFERGSGEYYLRGTYKKIAPFFSKYSLARDEKIKSRGYEEDKIGLPRRGIKGGKFTSRILHNSDGYIRRY